ncbi:MAG: hypothetical protein L6Q37_07785 [Bdellovibrionaceae bacterium]|nr:hypothetical protein [Pseudobdellovibrionaceae bacterium]NUM59181.1 hypothetical protein [Pseudobdellovibrionaceae bacterium]
MAGSNQASSSSSNSNFLEKAQKRAASRWTLSEWLAQKEKSKLMDMWLAMNSPSPYEFMLGAANNNYEKIATETPLQKQTIYSFQSLAYAKNFGIGIEYDNKTPENSYDLSGLLNLRLLGNSIQNTSLQIHLGQRTRKITTDTQSFLIRNTLGQISLQIYLTPYFGVNSFYRAYQPYEDQTLGKVTGKLVSYSIFIDFKILRVFGEWYSDTQTVDSTSLASPLLPSETKINGIKTGIQFYF